MITLKKSLFIAMLLFAGCKPTPEKKGNDYFIRDFKMDAPGLTILKSDSYQQSTDYTCGPSAVVTLLRYYGMDGDEILIGREMGTNDEVGTTPEAIESWLNTNGFNAKWSENGSLEMLREKLEKGEPTLVEWSDWGGHWVLVVGYDTRTTESISDDVIIFADPYDYHDDNQDGLTWFNAERFLYMWYDELLFDSLMTRVYVEAVPSN
ncbi:MAG: C39 family peptidase [Flavobacteriales bacterium]|nr:C39 family peptidase [Flavobacteriales bacterium]